MPTICTHVGVWTRYVNDNTEAALRMIRHVKDVTRFSEGFLAELDAGSDTAVSSDVLNAVTKFAFVENVGEYGIGMELPV